MNFDFDNPEIYLRDQPTDEGRLNIAKMDTTIGETVLSDYDRRFITDIKKKVLISKALTEKKAAHLGRILAACKAGTYVIKGPRGAPRSARRGGLRGPIGADRLLRPELSDAANVIDLR